MEKLSEQQVRGVSEVLNGLGVSKTFFAGHWAGAGKSAYVEASHPDIDADFGVSCNLGSVPLTLSSLNDMIEAVHIEKCPAIVINNEQSMLHPIGLGIDTNWIIRDEEEHVEFVRGVQSALRGLSSEMSYETLISFSSGAEQLSPKERKKRYREGLQNKFKKGKRW